MPQLRLAVALRNSRDVPSVESLCRRARVSVNALFRFTCEPDFREWWKQNSDQVAANVTIPFEQWTGDEGYLKVGFFRVGDVRLELLEPTDPTSTVAAFIEKRGEGLHHVAYTVASIDDRLAQLKEQGVRLIDERPRDGAHHTRIAFLHPKASAGVLTELCEPQSQSATH